MEDWKCSCWFFEEFKAFLSKVEWELFIPKDAVIYIKVDSLQSKLYHEGLLKEEVENKLQGLKYELTQHELNSTFRLFVSQEKNRTNVYLSLNGESLYKRSYKKAFMQRLLLKNIWEQRF